MRIHPAALLIPALLLPACSDDGPGGSYDTALDVDAQARLPIGHPYVFALFADCLGWEALLHGRTERKLR